MGTLELSNPPGWGPKKRANAPSSVNAATLFIVHVRFFVSVNVFLCNTAFPIRLHAVTTSVYGFSIVIKLLTLKL